MNNLEKEFVPYEQAVALKELRFDEPCFGYYEPNKKFKYLNWETFKDFPYLAKNSEWQDLYGAPTFSQAFRWFREKYGLWQIVPQNTDIDWTYDILPINGIHDYSLIDVFETYEEAELECLKKLIEITKTK
jgi:hypothetical protein